MIRYQLRPKKKNSVGGRWVVVAASKEVPHHLFSLLSVEILAFRPLGGLSSSRHAFAGDRKAFDRVLKVGMMVVSSDLC